jgi:hypothetical protein
MCSNNLIHSDLKKNYLESFPREMWEINSVSAVCLIHPKISILEFIWNDSTVEDEIHLWQMIFIYGRRFEKLVFSAYGMNFSALSLILWIRWKNRKNQIFLLINNLNQTIWMIIVQYGCLISFGIDNWELDDFSPVADDMSICGW